MAKQSYTLIDGSWIPTGGPPGIDSTVPGPAGPAGQGVPTGGTDGQVLAKNSTTNYDTEWIDPPVSTGGVIISPEPPDPESLPEGTIWIDEDSIIESVLPIGGADGQVLTKASATDFDVAWEALAGGAAGGSTILSGTATPTAGTGTVGDYYLDTDDRVLYGPRGTGTSSSSAHTSQVPNDTTSYTNYASWATKITFATAGSVTALKYYRPASATADPLMTELKLWTDGGVALAIATTAAETTTEGWKTAILATPVGVTAGQVVRVAVHLATGRRRALITPSFAYTNGDLTAAKDAYYYLGGTYSFPDTAWTDYHVLADVVFVTGGAEIWPVALKSVPPGGTTSQVLAKTTATDYDASWSTAPAATPSGVLNKDLLRWSSPTTTYADISYTTDGTNGLISWHRTNIGTPATTQSSVLNTGNEAASAVDGNLTTYFHTGNSVNEWMRVDFGSTRAVIPTSLSIYGRSGDSSHRIQHFDIQGSNDGTTWTNVYSTSGSANPITSGVWKNIPTVATQFYRYIRIYQTGLNTSGFNYITFGEIEIYGQLVNSAVVAGTWVAERDAPADGSTYGRKNGGWAAAAAGSTILTGTGAPADALGNVGDYYLDKSGNVLYGPKAAPGFGAPQSAFTSQVHDTTTTNYGYTFGHDFTFAKAGRVTGMRYYRVSNALLTSRLMRLWSSPTTEAGACTTSGDTGAGWMSALFPTPVNVAAGQTMRGAFDIGVSQDRWPSTAASLGALVNGDVTMGAQAYFLSHAGTGAYPQNARAGTYFIDVIYEATATIWPVALKSVPPGGTAAQVLAKTDAVDYNAAWAAIAGGVAADSDQNIIGNQVFS